MVLVLLEIAVVIICVLLCSGRSASSTVIAVSHPWISPPKTLVSWLWGCSTAPWASTMPRVWTIKRVSPAAGENHLCHIELKIEVCFPKTLSAFFECVCSSECPKRHQHPVWQVRYTKQQMSLSGDDSVENVISVSADGRVTKWLLGSNGLDCIGMIQALENSSNTTTDRLDTVIELLRGRKIQVNTFFHYLFIIMIIIMIIIITLFI